MTIHEQASQRAAQTYSDRIGGQPLDSEAAFAGWPSVHSRHHV